MENIKRITLWSAPRNISTALMYSFAQRSDTKVVDEPLYGHYLKNSPAAVYHPGAEEIISSMETDAKKVIQHMLSDGDKPVLFLKNMSHHLSGLNRRFLNDLINIILTRNPKEMLPSFAKVIARPTIEDVGYKIHMDLVNQFQKEKTPFVVIDATQFLLQPEVQLKKLCAFAEIPFDPNMLQWQPGARPEDGCWAKYWYHNVHQSTGFLPYQPKTEVFPDHLYPILKECQYYYKKLLELAL